MSANEDLSPHREQFSGTVMEYRPELGARTGLHSLYNKTLHLKVKLILCGKFSVPDWRYK